MKAHAMVKEKGKLRRWIVSLTCLALLLCGGLLINKPGEVGKKQPPLLMPRESSDEKALVELGEDPEGREDWFLFQRTYPYDALPADARQRAWVARPRGPALASGVTPAALAWRAIGPSPTRSGFFRNWGLTSGRINAVAVSPADDQIVLVGSGTGGIWRSTNAGATFVPVSDNHVDLAVGSIAFSKSNPAIVYAGMGDIKNGYLGTGVLKSTNGGRTWTRVSNHTLPSPGAISKIEVDPDDPNRVYAGQYAKLTAERPAASGFYLSTDGGVNWTQTLAASPRDLAVDPFDSRVLYLGVGRTARLDDPPELRDPLAGLYRSTDRGVTWTNIYTTPYDQYRTRDIRIALSPVRPQTLFVYTGGFIGSSFDVRLLVSTDGGETWTNRGSADLDTAQFGYNTYIVADPADVDTLYVGSRDLFKSTNGGQSWKNITESFTFNGATYLYTPRISQAHPDQHAFAFSPTDRRVIYIGNDGGIYKSTDGGDTFRSFNETLSLTQFVSIALHPADPQITYGGTQDNGTQKRFLNSGQWAEFITGDGGDCVINPIHPATVFTSYIRGTIFRFYDNGDSYDRQISDNSTFGEPDGVPRIAFYPPFTGNGVDQTLYIGTWRLFVSTDEGNSWSAPGGETDLTKGVTEIWRDVLSAIAIARSNTNVIYTGSARGRAMVSADGGKTWKDITTGLPDRFISSIVVSPTDPALAYLSVSGFRSGHVFKTTDMGVTWADVSGNLPDIPTNALLIDPIDPNTIYAGTDIGVFRSATGGNTWRSFSDGMPPVVVTAFAAQASGLIQAATYGRGAFEVDTGAGRPFIFSASFDGRKKLTISGTRFGSGPKVLINGTDRSSRIRASSDKTLKLKGKPEQLGLTSGENTVQVVNADGISSSVYTLKVP
ncbi:MAG TPA: hypothetical protein VNO70_19765 [Blastocatellia bacterium]|nr:hypothetical protein [Blastocatellia bacterium]